MKIARAALGSAALLAVLGAALGARVWLALPAVDGRAAVPGLAAPLEIVRDAHAIPHIYASSPADAYFGLGYVHAQDRLWQMEQARRVASGTLAELIGARAVDSDRLFRGLGLARLARASYARLDPDTRDALQAYARGVNAWIEAAPALPIEFGLLGCAPAAWEPPDSLKFILLLAWQLSGNWSEELWRVRLAARLPLEQLAEFAPPYPGYDALPLDELFGVYATLGLELSPAHAPQGALARPRDSRLALLLAPAAAQLGPLAPRGLGVAVGSNNWAVDGPHSQSGKPLLANDPHLSLTAPSQWYLAHLEAPGLQVIGATLPALPGVILGRNARVAWAFTNTFPDAQDVYLERLAPGDPGRYVTPAGTEPFETRREVIHVRGAPDLPIELRRTRHGPVLSDLSPEAQRLMPEGYVLSLAWAAEREDDETAAFPLRAARAASAQELRQAARAFQAATQNLVYADVDGSIGFVAAGRIPLRRSDNELRGSLPAPGWLERYDWAGFVPFEELPRLESPGSGRIVTANQRITPPGYPHWLGGDWGAPYRAERIGALLDAEARHSLDSFARIQADVHSSIADRLLEPLLGALPEPNDARGRELRERLRRWDRSMRSDALEPLVFAAWLRELARGVYSDELGELFADEWSERPEFLRRVLEDAAGAARWCDDRRTPARESCALQVGRAWSAALAHLEQRFGSEPQAWSWGAAHPSVSEHALLGTLPLLSRWANLNVARGGDSSSVNVGSYWPGDEQAPFSNAWGPGLRALYDLSDLNRSRAILNSGQSGQLLSPHYRDMNQPWARDEYVPLTTERAAIARGALGTLVLLPILVDNNSH